MRLDRRSGLFDVKGCHRLLFSPLHPPFRVYIGHLFTLSIALICPSLNPHHSGLVYPVISYMILPYGRAYIDRMDMMPHRPGRTVPRIRPSQADSYKRLKQVYDLTIWLAGS